jgi:2-deoxy-D-gluconate 3-dehydrogenase
VILDDFRLDGRVALVTGGNRGLGQGCAIALAEAGADVALLSRGDPALTVKRIADLGRRVIALPGDLAVAGPAELGAAVAAVVSELGGLDILVNNAGVIRRADATEVTPAEWDEVLTVDLDAVFHLSQAAGRVMLDHGRGKIVNVASMLSFQGGIRVPAYTAAKHGLVGLTKALAIEFTKDRIRVNAVCPGGMVTPQATEFAAPEDADWNLIMRIASPRGLMDPMDVAKMVAFLASDDAVAIHGAIYTVDNGKSAG